MEKRALWTVTYERGGVVQNAEVYDNETLAELVVAGADKLFNLDEGIDDDHKDYLTVQMFPTVLNSPNTTLPRHGG